jgi:formylglycine-generating enzyme required for sulfatase activity
LGNNFDDSSTPPPSCQDSALLCNGESCCESLYVPGGKFNRGGSPPYPATVAGYYLDKFEVTVARFRQFLTSYVAWQNSPPEQDAGKHPLIPGTGWNPAWFTEANFPTDVQVLLGKDYLICSSQGDSTWTDRVGSAENETRPINCLNWYEAFAFCLWDGARLPTEAEWQSAASGGDKGFLYPWLWNGNSKDLPIDMLALYGGKSPEPVGSLPNGNALWGQSHMAGNASEWVLDSYEDYSRSPECDNCATLTEGLPRVVRGGSAASLLSSDLATTARGFSAPETHSWANGLRCARDHRP